MSPLRTISHDGFDTAIAGPGAVLVEFGGEWCQPCRRLEPELAALGDDTAFRCEIVRVDVDADPELAGRFQVMSVPTLLIFVDGVARRRVVGFRTADEIRAEASDLLPPPNSPRVPPENPGSARGTNPAETPESS